MSSWLFACPCTYTLQNPEEKEFSTSSRYVLESPTNYHILQEAATDAKVFFQLLFINEIYVLDYLPCRSTERPTRAKRTVYLRAHQNGYLVVTGRNSFTYEDFYDIRDEEEVWGVRGDKENYSRPLFFSFNDLREPRQPSDPRLAIRRHSIHICEILSMAGPVI